MKDSLLISRIIQNKEFCIIVKLVIFVTKLNVSILPNSPEERGNYMQKLRRWLSIALIISMAFLLPVSVSAQTTPAQISFVASILDANNNFTVTMTISNATFNVFQFALRYDITKFRPIDKETKQETNLFSRFTSTNGEIVGSFTTLGTQLDTELGLFDFTQYINPGSSFVYEANTVQNSAAIGITPLLFYTFYFHQLSSGGSFELAKEDITKPYRNYLPNGGGLAYAGSQLSANVTFDFSSLQGKVVNEEYVSPEIPIQPNPEPTQPIKPPPLELPVDQDSPLQRPKTSVERLRNTVIMQIGNYAAAKDGALCHIYPGEKEVTPYIRENRTYVPVRFIAEKLGMKVTWEDTTKTVYFTKGDIELTLKIGEYRYSNNNISHAMDAPAELKNDRTMVPVRFIAEAMGYAIEWNAVLKMVFITDSQLPWLLENPIEEEATSDAVFVMSPLIRDFV